MKNDGIHQRYGDEDERERIFKQQIEQAHGLSPCYMSGFFDFSVIVTNFLTAGVTTITVGNATVNANAHALKHIVC